MKNSHRKKHGQTNKNKHFKGKIKQKIKTKHGSDVGSNKSKNFKFIQRGKQTTESLRQQQINEEKYKQSASAGNDLFTNEVNLLTDYIEEDATVGETPYESLSMKFKRKTGTGTRELLETLEQSDSDITSDSEAENIKQEKNNTALNNSAKVVENKSNKIESFENDNHEMEQSGEIVDSFSIHLDYDLAPEHIENLVTTPVKTKTAMLTWPTLGKLQIDIPIAGTSQEKTGTKVKTLLDDDEMYATEGTVPICSKVDLRKYAVKPQLLSATTELLLNDFQSELFCIVNNYQDLFYPQQNFQNTVDIRYVYSLHILNHMLKTRSRIIQHNAKLAAATAKMPKKQKSKIETQNQIDYRDQGLVRPKVLILVPFRNSALQVVNTMASILFGSQVETAKTNGSITNYSRFVEEYGGGNSIYFPTTNPKPEDYEQTFAGNTDDNFRLGMALTKKCIKMYTEFYASDIIIASPLGLRTIIGAPGDAERDFDFLNSIELMILDQAELFLAQNWDHVLHIADHMHLQPESIRSETDYSRVRSWCVNGLSRFYRQTLIFTSHELPEFRSYFHSKCLNYRGRIHVNNPITVGSIQHVVLTLAQNFHRIDAPNFTSTFDCRFNYFTQKILPNFKNASMAHCMIYVPSYFDYVRLRNYFKAESINFVQICEYTKDDKIARARDIFYHSGAPFLLYSERSHFFRRTRIKGIRHLIVYQPPCWPHLYAELLNLMQDSNQNARDGLEGHMSVTVLYTKYDIYHISGIIGSDRAIKLMQSRNETHIFRAK